MRIVVIHYEPVEAAALAGRLCRDGIDAEAYQWLGTKGFRHLRADPPDAVVIDLMRMPSYGRAMGEMLRASKGTRGIPLVFLEGDPAKTARVREILPDAVFAPLDRLAAGVRSAVRAAPANPAPPRVPAASIAHKLRVREGSTVSLIGAPGGFGANLPGAAIGSGGEVVLLFVKSAAGLGRELPRLARALPRSLWVLWPKRTSSAAGDLTLPRIHDACAPLGLVAYKTCSIDETWSAAAVSRRRAAHFPRPK